MRFAMTAFNIRKKITTVTMFLFIIQPFTISIFLKPCFLVIEPLSVAARPSVTVTGISVHFPLYHAFLFFPINESFLYFSLSDTFLKLPISFCRNFTKITLDFYLELLLFFWKQKCFIKSGICQSAMNHQKFFKMFEIHMLQKFL